MPIILMPIGSQGDVNPFIGFGKALQDRGHDVILVTSSYFESLAQRANLPFIGVGTKEDFNKYIHHPDVWHPINGFKMVANEIALTWMRHTYELIQKLYKPKETVVVSSILGFSARLAQEKLNIPFASVFLQPSAAFNLQDPPDLDFTVNKPWLPNWLKSLVVWTGHRLVIDPIICPGLNQFRKELGLRPVKRVLDKWTISPQASIGFYPKWFANTKIKNITLTDFPLYDESKISKPLPEEISRFITEGVSPVVFTIGTAMTQGNEFFKKAVDICKYSDRRGILLTKFPKQLPTLPSYVKHFDYIPFSQVFPMVEAVVHHGGIGTMAQCMQAGTAQLIMPMAHDQPDNGVRVRKLGIGDVLLPKSFTVENAIASLDKLKNSKVKSKCKEVASRFIGIDPYTKACEVVEKLMV